MSCYIMKSVKSLVVLLTVCISATHGVDLYWRQFNGTVPRDAIIPEYGLLIGQIAFNNSTLPGTFNTHTAALTTMAFNKKIVVINPKEIKILCTTEPDRFYWEYVNVDSLTKDKLHTLVVGGFEDQSTLYIGKVFDNSQWKIGKVFPPSSQWAALHLWRDSALDGCCLQLTDFMILSFYE